MNKVLNNNKMQRYTTLLLRNGRFELLQTLPNLPIMYTINKMTIYNKKPKRLILDFY